MAEKVPPVVSEPHAASTLTPAQSWAQRLANLPARAAFGGYSLQELDLMAECLVQSGLMPGVSSKSMALMVMMKVASTGLNPAEVYDLYDFIPPTRRGRAGQFRKKSLAVWAALSKLGGRIKRNKVWNSNQITLVFSFPGSPDLDVHHSIAALKEAGLITYYKDGQKVVRDQWRVRPKDMLFYTSVREAAKFYAPWVISDVRLPGEAPGAQPQPLDTAEDMKEVTLVPADVVPEEEPEEEPVEPGEVLDGTEDEEPPPEADDNLSEDGPGQREIG